MQTQLQRIAEAAKTRPKERFTSLIHLVNKENLIKCHKEMDSVDCQVNLGSLQS